LNREYPNAFQGLGINLTRICLRRENELG
jgi:hypothetical protein